MRKWFYGLNFALLAAFVIAFAMDHNAEWKTYQKNYYKMGSEALAAQAAAEKDPAKAASLRDQAKRLRRSPVEIKQVISRDLGRVDRCVTCHVGMDEYVNPTLTNDFKEHPYKAHPKLELLAKNHPFTKYGCTACHDGQGLGTTAKDAHGKVHNWEEPMLEGKTIQGACVRCHGDFEKLKGAEVAAEGKRLFYKHGCVGCHAVRGAGGVVSVDLGDIADKPLERIAGYNFARVMKDGKPLDQHDWTRAHWILGHLTNDPMEVTPNDPFAKYNAEPIAPSGMPDFRAELGQDGAEAITAWLMSMTARQVPNNYYVHAAPAPEPKFSDPVKHGKYVFDKYGCAGCHGLEAKAGRRNFNALGAGQKDPAADMHLGREPTLPDTAGTFTKEELMAKIQQGVPSSAVKKFNPDGPTPPLYMPTWKDKIKGEELSHLADYLLSIAKKEDLGF